MSRALRVAVVGATGALGGEVLSLLEESASELSVESVLPLATSRSQGESVDFRGESLAVRAEAELAGQDLLLCCAPPDASLGWVRKALHAEVPCVDASGALALSTDVPLCAAVLDPQCGVGAPLVAAPPGAALALALVLDPIRRAAGLARVGATLLESSAAGGRDAIAALGAESIALFNQADPPISAGRPLAFDCHPAIGDVEEDGSTALETRVARTLGRLFGAPVPISIAIAQIPVFVGVAAQVSLDTQTPLDPKQVRELLVAAPSVELWTHDAEGPNLRAAAGRSEVLVGRLRADPTRERGLSLWLAADPLRLAASNALMLAQRIVKPG
ncbi:MAG TPA: Asd/ArgC dimerization domain-containing protein [Myxococcota bacterium]|nr:Asd/ArgC dimerization domain-containing protein [Myxococcota bacterium]